MAHLRVSLSSDSDAEEGDYGANDDEMLEEEASAPPRTVEEAATVPTVGLLCEDPVETEDAA